MYFMISSWVTNYIIYVPSVCDGKYAVIWQKEALHKIAFCRYGPKRIFFNVEINVYKYLALRVHPWLKHLPTKHFSIWRLGGVKWGLLLMTFVKYFLCSVIWTTGTSSYICLKIQNMPKSLIKRSNSNLIVGFFLLSDYLTFLLEFI